MRILVFTRLENNTGGDEALLHMVMKQIVQGLPGADPHQIHVHLVHDPVSKLRAESIGAHILEYASKTQNATPIRVTASLITTDEVLKQAHPRQQSSVRFSKINELTDQEPVDIFVLAGWSHKQTKEDAWFILYEISVVQFHTKILLCCPPGAYPNKTFVWRIQDPRVYFFQPSLYGPAGLPRSDGMQSLGTPNLREAWRIHLQQSVSADRQSEVIHALSDGHHRDKLIVIYCSKDPPGVYGPVFLKRIKDSIPEAELPAYRVLLVGVDVRSAQFTQWTRACKVLLGDGFPSPIPLARTNDSSVLMQGFKDASFSMATGSFSILEARAYGIECAYLTPPHLTDFGQQLEAAGSEAIKTAFKRGDETFQELQMIPNANFTPELTSPIHVFCSVEDERRYFPAALYAEHASIHRQIANAHAELAVAKSESIDTKIPDYQSHHWLSDRHAKLAEVYQQLSGLENTKIGIQRQLTSTIARQRPQVQLEQDEDDSYATIDDDGDIIKQELSQVEAQIHSLKEICSQYESKLAQQDHDEQAAVAQLPSRATARLAAAPNTKMDIDSKREMLANLADKLRELSSSGATSARQLNTATGPDSDDDKHDKPLC